MTDTRRRQHFFAVLAAALLVVMNLGVFATFEIHTSNQSEFDSSYRDTLPLLIGFCGGTVLLLALVGFFLRGRSGQIYSCILVAAGVLLWIQGSFIKWGYGELDGRGINWDRFSWQGWVDGTIWLGVLAGAVILHRKLYRYVFFLAVVFLVTQSVFVGARGLSGGRDSATVTTATDVVTVPANICQLSTTKNIFHIIMDSFQTDVFMELVEEGGLQDELDGFVLYKDNLAVGRRTVLCVPAIFTGEIYDGTVSESEYFRATMKNSFHALLHRSDYTVNLVPHITMENMRRTNYFSSPVSYATPRQTRLLRNAAFLIDLSLFRQLPHFLKRFVHNNDNWRLSSLMTDPPSHSSFHQKAFFQDYTDKLNASEKRPAYHFIHLMPPHPPYVTTADGHYTGKTLPGTRENGKNEARYALRLFMEFTDKLKQIGVYDSSIILLQGDHGTGFPPQFDGKPSTSNNRSGRALALLLLKNTSVRGALQVTDAPSSIADIPATIVDLLNIDHDYPGISLLQLDEAAQRDRNVVYVTKRSETNPVVRRWAVRGSVADTTSWHEQDAIIVERKLTAYKWGQILGFGITGNGEPYLGSGWTTTSPTVHWSNDASAYLRFAITPPDGDVRLRFTFFPHIVPGRIDQQRIQMNINGYDVGGVTCTENKSLYLDITVKHAVLDADTMVVRFDFPDVASSTDLGADDGSETRVMGLYSIETTPLQPAGQ
jgi:hypothetical protein